eukprot:gb/GECG01005537.1/.p1 GENE.gb/GECG01005537.1/~~gb/GECG01005537.1/.p1  ORF type:complete len:421 (+),score=58.30 gb/GECG01005537.1/:1-1263(+)
MMKVAMVVFYLVAKPMALIIDCTFGEELGRYYSKEEFTKLIDTHSEIFTSDKRQIMQGALKFSDATAGDIMTPSDKVFSLSSKDRLDYDVMSEIFRTGYSRIPVWNARRTWIIGLLYSKDLILVSPQEELPVMAVVTLFHREKVPIVNIDDNLNEVLMQMHAERVHFAAVRKVDDSVPDRDPIYALAGCITMEDILEQILQMDVEDEHDASNDAADTQARELAQMHRLNLLSLSGMKEGLPPSLSRAIAHTLLETVPAFSEEAIPGKWGNLDTLVHLLQNARILYLSKPNGNEPVSEEEPLTSSESALSSIAEAQKVWKQGGVLVKKTSTLSGPIIVLQGKLDVECGQDNIKTVIKPFECIGEGSLLKGDYVTDFRVTLGSPEVTVIRIDRENYVKALKGERLTPPGRDASVDEIAIDIT